MSLVLLWRSLKESFCSWNGRAIRNYQNHNVCRITCKISSKVCAISFHTFTFQLLLNLVFHALNHPFQFDAQHFIFPHKWFLWFSSYDLFIAYLKSRVKWILKQPEHSAYGNVFSQTNCPPFHMQGFVYFILFFKQLQSFNNIHHQEELWIPSPPLQPEIIQRIDVTALWLSRLSHENKSKTFSTKILTSSIHPFIIIKEVLTAYEKLTNDSS